LDNKVDDTILKSLHTNETTLTKLQFAWFTIPPRKQMITALFWVTVER